MFCIDCCTQSPPTSELSIIIPPIDPIDQEEGEYHGNLNEGLRHDPRGEIYLRNEGIYTGPFVHGYRHGKSGYLYFKDDHGKFFEYFGNFNLNEIDGKGLLIQRGIWPSGPEGIQRLNNYDDKDEFIAIEIDKLLPSENPSRIISRYFKGDFADGKKHGRGHELSVYYSEDITSVYNGILPLFILLKHGEFVKDKLCGDSCIIQVIFLPKKFNKIDSNLLPIISTETIGGIMYCGEVKSNLPDSTTTPSYIQWLLNDMAYIGKFSRGMPIGLGYYLSNQNTVGFSSTATEEGKTDMKDISDVDLEKILKNAEDRKKNICEYCEYCMDDVHSLWKVFLGDDIIDSI